MVQEREGTLGERECEPLTRSSIGSLSQSSEGPKRVLEVFHDLPCDGFADLCLEVVHLLTEKSSNLTSTRAVTLEREGGEGTRRLEGERERWRKWEREREIERAHSHECTCA